LSAETEQVSSIEDKKSAKERALLEAGTILFAEKGYIGTTVEDIAREAGVAKGTFYLYFSDKAQLFKRILETASKMHEAEQEKIFKIPTPIAQLRRYIELQLDFFSNNVYLARISIREIHGLEGEAAEIFFRAAARHTALLGRIIAQGAHTGALACSDPQSCAVALTGLINYYLVWENLNEVKKERNEAVDFLLGLALNGLQG